MHENPPTASLKGPEGGFAHGEEGRAKGRKGTTSEITRIDFFLHHQPILKGCEAKDANTDT
jgi:hypothetical protein